MLAVGGWRKAANGAQRTRRKSVALLSLLVALSFGAFSMTSAAYGGGPPSGTRMAQASPPNPRAGTPAPAGSRIQLLAQAQRWAWLTGTPDASKVAQSPFDLVALASPNGTIAPADVGRMRARGASLPRRLVLAVYHISSLEKIDLIAALSAAMSQDVDGIVLTGLNAAGKAEGAERVAAAARRMDPTFLLVAHVATSLPRLANVLAAMDAVVVEGAFAAEPGSPVPRLIATTRASARPVLALERSGTPQREAALAARASKAGVRLYVGPRDLAYLAVDQPKP